MLRMPFLPLVFACGLMSLSVLSASGNELNKLERDQLGNSAQPDVDPNASGGKDPSIVTQEKEQIDNSAEPDVDPQASTGRDESLVKQEKDQIPH